ncbi:MAG: hypothetical protein ABMA64_24855 [Myxococcota bacterium]
MSYALVLASVLWVPTVAFAADGPESDRVGPYVGDADLDTELAGVNVALDAARARLKEATGAADVARVDAATATYGVSEARTDQDLGTTHSGSEVDVAGHEIEQAKLELSAARHERSVRRAERRLAEQRGDKAELSRAKIAVSEADGVVVAHKAELSKARTEYRRTDDKRDRSTAQDQAAVDVAQEDRASAMDRVDEQGEQLAVAAGAVVAWETYRTRLIAQIAYGEALRTGADATSLATLEATLGDARVAEADAAARLTKLEADATSL